MNGEDLVSKLVGLATLSFAAFLLILFLSTASYKGISSQTFFFSSSFFSFLSVISTYKLAFQLLGTF